MKAKYGEPPKKYFEKAKKNLSHDEIDFVVSLMPLEETSKKDSRPFFTFEEPYFFEDVEGRERIVTIYTNGDTTPRGYFQVDWDSKINPYSDDYQVSAAGLKMLRENEALREKITDTILEAIWDWYLEQYEIKHNKLPEETEAIEAIIAFIKEAAEC